MTRAQVDDCWFDVDPLRLERIGTRLLVRGHVAHKQVMYDDDQLHYLSVLTRGEELLAGFGVLLLTTARAATAEVGPAISAGLSWTYGAGSVLLLIQQTQIWMTPAGAATVVVSLLLALGYGATRLVHRERNTAPRTAG